MLSSYGFQPWSVSQSHVTFAVGAAATGSTGAEVPGTKTTEAALTAISKNDAAIQCKERFKQEKVMDD